MAREMLLAAAVLLALFCEPSQAQFAIFQVSNTSNGFTVFTPTIGLGSCSAGTYTGTCIIYASTGGNDGTCAPQIPPATQTPSAGVACATIAKAQSLLRNNKPDWMLLKQGDTFTDCFSGANDSTPWLFSGVSSSQPMLISAYGSGGVRPIVTPNVTNSGGDGCLHVLGAGHGDFLAIVGVDFYSTARDPNSASLSASEVWGVPTAIAYTQPVNWLLLEDNVFRFSGLAFSYSVTATPAANITLNRNIIRNQYSVVGRAQGVFTGGDGFGVGDPTITMTENFFTENGQNIQFTNAVSVAITQASPGVVTWTNSSKFLKNNANVYFASTGGGITAGTSYFVVNQSGDTFQFSLSKGGAAVNTSAGLVSPQNIQWVDAAGNNGNRNAYIYSSSASSFTGNAFLNSSAEGAQFRTGGTIANNLFDTNGVNCFDLGHNQNDGLTTSATISKNVCLHTNYLAPGTPLQGAIGGAFTFYATTTGVNVTKALIAHITTVSPVSPAFLYDTGAGGVSVTGSVACDWSGFGQISQDNSVSGAIQWISNVGREGSSLSSGAGSGYVNGSYSNVPLTGGAGTGAQASMSVAGGAVSTFGNTGAMTAGSGYATGNTLSAANSSLGGSGAGLSLTVGGAVSASNTQSGNTFQIANCNGLGFLDPTRTTATYDSTILGGPGTLADFVSKNISRAGRTWDASTASWDATLTATNVNNWVRPGYNMTNFLLKRDLNPANNNTPMWLNEVA